MPSLTGPQFNDFHKALLGAFDRAGLQRMVRFELGENLDAITGGGSLSQTVFELIEWSERRGRRDDLLIGALKQNPKNRELLTLADELDVEPPSGETAAEQSESRSADTQPSINTGGGAYIAGNVTIQGGDFVGRDKVEQRQDPWWDQLAEFAGGPGSQDKRGGDVIIAHIGDGAKNVAIGKDIQQNIYEVIGEPTADDQAIIEQQLAALSGQIDAAQRQMATFPLQVLETELSKTGEDEQPSGSAITQAGDWLLENLPDIGEALASFFALPAVGRVLGKAGQGTIKWAAERFGDTSE